MSDITLRSLYPEDIDQVTKIESGLTGGSRRVFLENRLAVATAMPDSFITCAALDDKKLAGYGFARILEGEFGARSTIAVLDIFGVDPEYQGRGIATMLMSALERRMKNRKISTVQTQLVWSNHAMIRFLATAGFTLAPNQIIERDTSPLSISASPQDAPISAQVTVRPLKGVDIAAVDRIDTRITGLDRSAYYASKFREMLDGPDVRVSMVAETAGAITGFIMARVDYGEFGTMAKAAVIDTIGVHPDHVGTGVGHALLSQLLLKLSALKVETVRTKVDHENFGLRNFLARRGFRPSQLLMLTREIH